MKLIAELAETRVPLEKRVALDHVSPLFLSRQTKPIAEAATCLVPLDKPVAPINASPLLTSKQTNLIAELAETLVPLEKCVALVSAKRCKPIFRIAEFVEMPVTLAISVALAHANSAL